MTSESQGAASPWLGPTALALSSLAAALALAACQPVVAEAVDAAGAIEQAPALLIRDGESVRADQARPQVDTSPFDAAVVRARADLKVARAHEQLTASEAERARLMQADRSLCAENLDRRLAAHAQAQARSAAAEAALQAAQRQRDLRNTDS